MRPVRRILFCDGLGASRFRLSLTRWSIWSAERIGCGALDGFAETLIIAAHGPRPRGVITRSDIARCAGPKTGRHPG